MKEKEDADNQSLSFSKELTEQYPGSAVFKVFYSSILLQYGFPDEAIAAAEDALRLNNNSFKTDIIKSANAVIGSAYFRLNDYKKAIPHLEEHLKLANIEDRYNVYLFTLAVSHELTGNRVKALENYKKVRNDFINERDGELDKFFYRLAQDKIKNPINNFDLKLIKGLNLRESNRIDEAVNAYYEIIESDLTGLKKSDDDLIRLYYDLGVSYTYKKDFDKAIECFNKCIKLNPESEIWLIPHSYFELGKIYDKNGDKKKSADMFDKIFNYDDFDFESFLEMRLANYSRKS
ncbi:MAG: tetratricopeptide repeat protein [Ignavibacteria bacterium]|nr:tetratricopeptide repeat protein [Ignavibacteria bacterium]